MGNTNSAPIDPDTKGYHVLKVRENSPAAKANLEAYFDFIVSINEISLNSDPSIFPSIIKQNVKNQVLCTVFSSKTNEYRVVTLVPDWWAEEKDGLLGCSIRYCDYNGAAMHVWHVVDITKGSPAEMAGLQVDLDYILGSPDAILRDQQDLYSLITQKCEEKKAVKLFVYNSSSESIREVILLPNKEWGNGNVAGMIGAELGYGALHRIPIPSASKIPTKLVEEVSVSAPKEETFVQEGSSTSHSTSSAESGATSPLPDIHGHHPPSNLNKALPNIMIPPENKSTTYPHLLPLPPSRSPSPLPSPV